MNEKENDPKDKQESEIFYVLSGTGNLSGTVGDTLSGTVGDTLSGTVGDTFIALKSNTASPREYDPKLIGTAINLLGSAEIKSIEKLNIDNAEQSFRKILEEIDLMDIRIGENQARIEEIRKVSKQSFSELEGLVEEL
ncbi:MAG: hypothetical protein F6K47_07605 [Symploca sp. SIO2E6]|nr:hypothetical protein [Symploca sp. SIO2E6]